MCGEKGVVVGEEKPGVIVGENMLGEGCDKWKGKRGKMRRERPKKEKRYKENRFENCKLYAKMGGGGDRKGAGGISTRWRIP
jgi:hypothetical protein